MQRAVLKDWESYTDAELKLLLRFMTQGYETMLAATDMTCPAKSKGWFSASRMRRATVIAIGGLGGVTRMTPMSNSRLTSSISSA